MAHIILASVGSTLRSVLVEDPGTQQVWSGKKPGPHSPQHQASSQSIELEKPIRLIDELQSHRVPSLVHLSVCAVRDAIAGPIDLNLHSLLVGRPSQQERILRSQILLDEILCENALDGVEEAFDSAEAFQSKLSNFSQMIPPHNYFDDDSDDDPDF